MSGDAARDLEEWMGRLITVWRRRRRGRAGPPPRHGNRGSERRDWGRGQTDARRDVADEQPADGLTREELHEVGAAVRTLSLGLTRERELAGARYMDDPRLLGAYLLFYWPVSYAQARATLGELSRPRAVLDLGSGPGPVAFAAADAGASELIAADRSRAALELARELAIESSGAMGTREWSPERPLPEGRWDLITMGHVLNELYAGDTVRRVALVEQAAERLKPGGTLLILEPALRDTSRALLAVRDALVAKGYAVRAPCMWRGACPALLKPSDWCHAERQWRLPPLVEAIARTAGLHKESLKMSYLALAPKGEAWPALPEGRLFRIVSEPLEGKGRQRYMGCGPEGRVGLAMQQKHEAELNRAFFSLARGDVIRVSATEARGDGFALVAESVVDVIAPAGRPVR